MFPLPEAPRTSSLPLIRNSLKLLMPSSVRTAHTGGDGSRGLPIQLLVKYFTQNAELWQINAEIRSMVQHRQLNLLQDFSHLGVFDIIFCRNVLIYFDQNTKANIFERLSRMLEPDGVLALGAAESVVGITNTFKPYPERRGLYRPNVAPVIRVGASTLVPQTLRAVAAAR